MEEKSFLKKKVKILFQKSKHKDDNIENFDIVIIERSAYNACHHCQVN